MRILMLVLWMLIPVGAFAYHLGPGQNDMKRDSAAQLLADADDYASAKEWASAQELYEKALEKLPDDAIKTQRRIRLERAKCQLENKQLPEANDDLKVLVDELANAEDADQQLLSESRLALANSQYYITWLMRLEGLPRESWEPEITASQQLYRMLAEAADASGDTELISLRRKDLESAVKLARLDLGELQGLPLPNQ